MRPFVPLGHLLHMGLGLSHALAGQQKGAWDLPILVHHVEAGTNKVVAFVSNLLAQVECVVTSPNVATDRAHVPAP